MSAAPLADASTPVELTTVASIRDRYDLTGPHATAVIAVTVPGTAGDDFDLRWSATQAELVDLGAPIGTVRRLDDLIASMPRSDGSLLVTANANSAACCWLAYDADHAVRFGSLPALLPALHHLALAPGPLIGAVVDRTGADLYRFGALDVEALDTVEGDDEHIHKGASGGWSQARYQRHSEVIWERNAELISSAILDALGRHSAVGVTVTGDDREVRLVTDALGHRAGDVRRVHAGGRHEPQTPERLRHESSAFRADMHRQRTDRALGDLREELGQQDQAIAGAVAVLDAVSDNRVKTLFIDLLVGAGATHVDATIRAAMTHGADLVIDTDLDVTDGIAAILRMPYSP